MLEVVEYVYVDFVIRSVFLKQFPESVGEIVALGELEYRLVHLFAEPYHSLSDELRCPFARAHEPRSHVSCEQAG